MLDIPVLETGRLRLRGLAEADFERYAAMWAEPAVVRFISGSPLSREAAWHRFLRQAGHWAWMGFGYFAIEDRGTGTLLGEAGFQELRRKLSPSIEGTMEAGWVLAPAAQGRRFAEEAMNACLDWADRALPGRRITCIIHPDHAASLHIARKLGFTEFANSDYHGAPKLLLERARV